MAEDHDRSERNPNGIHADSETLYRCSTDERYIQSYSSHGISSWTYRCVSSAKASIVMAMTKSQAINLANFVHTVRPEWDFHGIMAALRKIADLDPVTAGHVALSAAGDPEAVTPMAVTNPVYRPEWKPASAAEAVQQRIARGNQLAERRRLEQLRADARNADPDSSHRGYLQAVSTLKGISA